MSSFYKAQYRDQLSQIKPLQSQADIPATWGEGAGASFNFMRDEGLSVSQERAFSPEFQTRAGTLQQAYGDGVDIYEGVSPSGRAYPMPNSGVYKYNKELINNGDVYLDENRRLVPTTDRGRKALTPGLVTGEQLYMQALVADAAKRFPELIETDDDLVARVTENLAEKRRKNLSVMGRAPKSSVFAGTAAGAVTDPLVAITMPMGVGWLRASGGIAANMVKAFGSETAIAAASETAIQTKVFAFKEMIDSPYSKTEALFMIAAAGIGAGTFRALMSGGIDTVGAGWRAWRATMAKREVVQALEAAGIDRSVARELVEEVVRRENTIPANTSREDHSLAVDQSRAQAEEGVPINVEATVPSERLLPGGRQPTGRNMEDFDASDLNVDAKLFQFKEGGDADGVSSKLKGLTSYNRDYAGVAVIWERADGKLFIADGHQRLGLAKRAIAAGQDPATAQIHGFRVREVDGVTPGNARDLAALKNIGEGSGTALDGAKVIRSLDEAGMAEMARSLPPNGAIGKQAIHLANLEGEAFQIAVNKIVPERQAALVGERLT